MYIPVCAFNIILIPLRFKKQLLMGLALEQTSTKEGEMNGKGFSNFYLGLLNFPLSLVSDKTEVNFTTKIQFLLWGGSCPTS